MTAFVSEYSPEIILAQELWASGKANIQAKKMGIEHVSGVRTIEHWEWTVTEPSGGELGTLRFSVEYDPAHVPSGFAPNAAGNGPPANSDVFALRWFDSNRNPIAELTGFSIKYSDFIAGASNSNVDQRYAFWVVADERQRHHYRRHNRRHSRGRHRRHGGDLVR